MCLLKKEVVYLRIDLTVALMEPLSVAIHVCRQAEVAAHKTVVVFGAGPVGLLCAAVSKAWGAKQVITVDIQKSRLEFAEKFASTGTFLPEKPGKDEPVIEYARKVGEKIKKQFNLGEGAHCVVDATGAEVCTLSGLFVCGKGATFVQAGEISLEMHLKLRNGQGRIERFPYCSRLFS
jgi:D-xylulose reductase